MESEPTPETIRSRQLWAEINFLSEEAAGNPTLAYLCILKGGRPDLPNLGPVPQNLSFFDLSDPSKIGEFKHQSFNWIHLVLPLDLPQNQPLVDENVDPKERLENILQGISPALKDQGTLSITEYNLNEAEVVKLAREAGFQPLLNYEPAAQIGGLPTSLFIARKPS